MERDINAMSVPDAEGVLPSAERTLTAQFLLLQAVAKAVDVPLPPQQGGLCNWQLKRLARYVDDNISRSISVAELAAVAKLSPSHFTRSFRISAGMAPHVFLITHRLELARALMLTSSRPLLDIALQCGLSDQAHFCRLFRRHFGMPPGQWRRKALAAQRPATLRRSRTDHPFRYGGQAQSFLQLAAG